MAHNDPKLALGKRRAQDTYSAEYRRKQDTLLDGIQPNERCFEPECNFGK